MLFTVPCEWLYHRCHCVYRDSVLFVGTALTPRAHVLRECLRRDVVCWWFFSLLVVLSILFGTV